MNNINKQNYKNYLFRIIGDYNNQETVYIYDGISYYYVISIDRNFKKSLKLEVFDVENNITKTVIYPINKQITHVIPIYNVN